MNKAMISPLLVGISTSVDSLSVNSPFAKELRVILNKHSIDTRCNTADVLLADFLIRQLQSFQALCEESVAFRQLKMPTAEVEAPEEMPPAPQPVVRQVVRKELNDEE